VNVEEVARAFMCCMEGLGWWIGRVCVDGQRALGMQVESRGELHADIPIRIQELDRNGANDLLGPKSVDWGGVQPMVAIMYEDGSGVKYCPQDLKLG
jgi:hypothetical protein